MRMTSKIHVGLVLPCARYISGKIFMKIRTWVFT